MQSSSTRVAVTKLDAAKRQLKTALRIWFHDGDPVSVHTLLSAAHEIIHRLYRKKGLVNLLFDSDLIKDEYRGHFAKKMKEAPNFFKHANNDEEMNAETVFLFDADMNAVLPLFLIQALVDMGEKLCFEERSYVYWTAVHEPAFFQRKASPFPIDQIQKIVGVNKKEFLDACELLWREGSLQEGLAPGPRDLKGS